MSHQIPLKLKLDLPFPMFLDEDILTSIECLIKLLKLPVVFQDQYQIFTNFMKNGLNERRPSIIRSSSKLMFIQFVFV